MINRNLFTGLVNNENDVTELLVNLMHVDTDFRKISLGILLNSLKDKNDESIVSKAVIEEINDCHIYTQYHTDYGIPDIVIENESCFFIIENKIRNNTSETENQIKNYPNILTKLKDDRVKGIVFLVPENYDVFVGDGYTQISYGVVFWNNLIADIKDNWNKELSAHVFNCFIDVIEKPEHLEPITKKEIELLVSDENGICETFKLKHLILGWTKAFIEKCNLIFVSESDGLYGIGCYFKVKEQSEDQFFIGLSPNVEDDKNFLAVSYFSKEYERGINAERDETGWWIFFPIEINYSLVKIEEKFETFCKNAKIALEDAIKYRYKKDLSLLINTEYIFKKGYFFKLDQFEIVKTVPAPSEVRSIMEVSEKLLTYIKKFVYSKDYSNRHKRIDFQGIGYDFIYNKILYFLGLDPSNNVNELTIWNYTLNKSAAIPKEWVASCDNQYKAFEDAAIETLQTVNLDINKDSNVSKS